MKNETFADIVCKSTLSLPTTDIHTEEGWADDVNTNLLMTDERYRSDSFTVIGIKTGTTPFSGYCLLSAVKLDTGSILYGAVLGASDEDTLYGFNKDLYENILDYYEEKLLFNDEEIFAYLEYDDNTIPLYPSEDIKVYVPKGYPASDLDIRTVPYDDNIFPAEAGTPLGTIDVMAGDKVVISYPLVSHIYIAAEGGEETETGTAGTEGGSEGTGDGRIGITSLDKLVTGILLALSFVIFIVIMITSINSYISEKSIERRKRKWEEYSKQK
jgi:hypothetical protein